MKQVEFERRNEAHWERMEACLSGGGVNRADGDTLPPLYRRVCADLALAKHRRYSPELLDRLNDLASRGYLAIYGAGHRHQRLWLRFLVVDFPWAIRRNWRLVVAAAALFLLPLAVMGGAAYATEEAIYSLFGPYEVRSWEGMYEPGRARVGRERDAGDDWMMFGYYIYNNVGIAFRTFATGLLFGLGSIFFLVYNGLAIGAIGGHLTKAGYGITFYPFVVGHSALELTGIVLSGAAGLKLGAALVAPGSLSRLGALRVAAGEAAVIVYGAGAMLVLAAAVEAFWSARSGLPAPLRYGMGGVLWVLVLSYVTSAWRLRPRGS